ncbi:MAG TPA: diguanylate cyclase [Methylococcus sp.]|nr:diguanylate cyclase [Methylococcus sp.]
MPIRSNVPVTALLARLEPENGAVGAGQGRRKEPNPVRLQQILEKVQAARGKCLARDRFLRSLLEQIPQALLVVDRKGRVAFANRAAERLAEVASGGLLRKRVLALLRRGERRRAFESFRRASSGTTGAFRMDRVRGGPQSLCVQWNVLPDREGQIDKIVFLGQPIPGRVPSGVTASLFSGSPEPIQEELSALHRIADAIARDIEVRELCVIVLHTLTRLLRADTDCGRGIFLREDGKMVPVVIQGSEPACLGTAPGVHVENCLCGRIVRTGEILVTRGCEHGSVVSGQTRARSRVLLPIEFQGKVLGVLYFYLLDPTARFDCQRLQTLLAITRLLGAAIENRRLQKERVMLSLSDPLTGLANRMHFETMLAVAIAEARRRGEPLSTLMLDLDHFGYYNAARGWRAGDRLLHWVGQVIEGELRVVDRVARDAEDRFWVLLPKTESAQAREIAERLREAIHEASGVRVSIGLACLGPEDRGVEDLIARADAARLWAKRSGRDRIAVAESRPTVAQESPPK